MCKFGQMKSQSLHIHVFKFSPCLHLKSCELSAKGADEAEEVGRPELLCLVPTTFKPGVELDVGVVAGCDSVQAEGGPEGASVEGGGTKELKTT